MQNYFVIRGDKDRIRKWKEDLAAQWYPVEYKHPTTGEIMVGEAQVSVRTIELIEVACTKEFEPKLMGMIRPIPWTRKAERFLKPFKFLPRLLGLKKPLAPEQWVIDPTLKLYNDWVQCIPLGTKDDVIQPLVKKEADTKEKV